MHLHRLPMLNPTSSGHSLGTPKLDESQSHTRAHTPVLPISWICFAEAIERSTNNTHRVRLTEHAYVQQDPSYCGAILRHQRWGFTANISSSSSARGRE